MIKSVPYYGGTYVTKMLRKILKVFRKTLNFFRKTLKMFREILKMFRKMQKMFSKKTNDVSRNIQKKCPELFLNIADVRSCMPLSKSSDIVV